MPQKLIDFLKRAWKLSGLKIDPAQFAFLSAVPAVALAFLSAVVYCFAGHFWISVEVFGFVLLCVTGLILCGVGGLIGYRQYKLAAQLPNTLEIVVSLLKTGLPISQALVEVSQTAPMPIKAELERVVAGMKDGKPIPDAVNEMTPYMMVPQLAELRDSIRVSLSSGGQLAQRIATIASELRDKDKERLLMKKSLSSFVLIPGIVALFLIGSLFSLAFDPASGAPFFESASTKLILFLIFAVPVVMVWKADKIQGLAAAVPETGVGASAQKFLVREKLKNELAKFMDLLIIPLESGVSLPAAAKVRQDSASSFPTLNRELEIV